MGFDGLVKRIGFERHLSREDFEIRDGVDDGVWGIYDEHAFLRAHQELEKIKRPFFATIYSLSSHTPYNIPSKEYERFGPSIPYRDFLNSVVYSDASLKKFFQAARESSYFKETLFVVVADHTEGPSTGGNLYEAYRIPCLLYGPAFVPPGRVEEVVSQLDIVPTVIDLLRISAPYTSWGKSIFAKEERMAILPRGDFFVVVKAPYLFLTDIGSPMGLYNFKTDPAKDLLNPGDKEAARVSEELGEELRGYLRFSYEMIMNNKVRPPY